MLNSKECFNRATILSLKPKIVELIGSSNNKQHAAIIGRVESTQKNPGVSILLTNIEIEKLSDRIYPGFNSVFIELFADDLLAEKENADSKNSIIKDGENTVSVRHLLTMAVEFDDEGNFRGFNNDLLHGRPMYFFIFDKKRNKIFRVDYKVDPNNPTKGIIDQISAFDNNEFAYYNQDNSLFPEDAPYEVDLMATLDMFLFGKRPSTKQPLGANKLASPKTLVVSWKETHP